MLATSQDAICLKKPGFKARLITWRALSINPYCEAVTAAKNRVAELKTQLAAAETSGAAAAAAAAAAHAAQQQGLATDSLAVRSSCTSIPVHTRRIFLSGLTLVSSTVCVPETSSRTTSQSLDSVQGMVWPCSAGAKAPCYVSRQEWVLWRDQGAN